MDQLEKEWFHLVRLLYLVVDIFIPLLNLVRHSPRRFRNQTWPFRPKTPLVLSVMTPKERTRMRLCFVTDAIWQFTKVRNHPLCSALRTESNTR